MKMKTACIVTGASRGFGQVIANSLFQEGGILQNTANAVKIWLIARSESGLQDTKAKILQASTGKQVEIETVVMDFADSASSTVKIKELFTCGAEEFDTAYLFSNAAILGDVSLRLCDHTDMTKLNEAFTVNITVPAFLLGQFMKTFEKCKRYLVNISTLAALQPFVYSAMYSTSKAAADMVFRVAAAEHPDARVLNYAPGPMATFMAETLRDNSGDEGIRRYFNDLYENKKILTCEESCKTLMKLLVEDTFESGAHIDYYDVISK